MKECLRPPRNDEKITSESNTFHGTGDPTRATISLYQPPFVLFHVMRNASTIIVRSFVLFLVAVGTVAMVTTMLNFVAFSLTTDPYLFDVEDVMFLFFFKNLPACHHPTALWAFFTMLLLALLVRSIMTTLMAPLMYLAARHAGLVQNRHGMNANSTRAIVAGISRLPTIVLLDLFLYLVFQLGASLPFLIAGFIYRPLGRLLVQLGVSPDVPPLLTLALIITSIILTFVLATWWAVSLQVFLLEETSRGGGLVHALKRSRELVKGSQWIVLGYIMLINGLGIIITAAIVRTWHVGDVLTCSQALPPAGNGIMLHCTTIDELAYFGRWFLEALAWFFVDGVDYLARVTLLAMLVVRHDTRQLLHRCLQQVKASPNASCYDHASPKDFFLVSTTEELAGKYRDIQHLGLVVGMSVRMRGPLGKWHALFQKLRGGEVSAFTKMLEEATEEALARMLAEATIRGGNGILKVVINNSSGNILRSFEFAQVVAHGTAVRVVKKEHGPEGDG